MSDILKTMPEMLTGITLEEKLRILPEYDENVIQKSVAERLIALQDIYQIYVPSKMSREIYSKMYLSLLRSLNKKLSINAIRQCNENAKAVRERSYESILGGSDSFTIIGPSGVGKSSAVSRAINILTENPILNFENAKIIACLQVQAPADSSVKGLLLEILRKSDEILQTNYHSNAIRSHATVDILIGIVSQVSLNHIGLLIIDEIQNVVNSKNGKIIVGTLTQLINNSGISICMVGTPETAIFFEQAPMLARRSLGLNYTMMAYGEEFRDFCKTILKYCYVKHRPIIDEQLLMWLYNHSSGNISVVVSLIHDAQEIAILEGSETIDIPMLKDTYDKRLGMLHDHIAPESTKTSPPKRKKLIPPQITDHSIGEFISIYDISQKAKTSGTDIVTGLKEHDINVIEVSL